MAGHVRGRRRPRGRVAIPGRAAAHRCEAGSRRWPRSPRADRADALARTKLMAMVPANPRPAATVVVLRDGPSGPEVFMVRRHADTAFMGGAHVFPGGRVDAADQDAGDGWCDGVEHARRQLASLPAPEALAYHVAAARELFEEAGVLLARGTDGRFVSLAGAAVHER